ncbi:MAG: creatininase family protein [Acidobacteriota bacterium]
MKTIRMVEMTWQDIRAAIDQGFTTVVVGVGSTEQHGPHLPTMTDTRIGDDLAHRVARKLGNALQARTIPFGVSEHHLVFGGTVSLSRETLRAILRDYVSSLARCGFRRIVFLPSHGGNFATVQEVIEEARTTQPDVVVTGYANLLGFSAVCERASARFGVSAGASGGHAGENETAMMLALEPDLVQRERFAAGYVGPLGEEQIRIVLEQGMTALTGNGVLGDPAGATAERGEVYLELLADFLASQVAEAPAPAARG